jgi:hypothetical protein
VREAEQTKQADREGGEKGKHMRSEHTHTVLLSLGNDEEAKRLCNATFIMTKYWKHLNEGNEGGIQSILKAGAYPQVWVLS